MFKYLRVIKKLSLAVLVVPWLALAGGSAVAKGPPPPPPNSTVTYSGQGLDADGLLKTELCGIENGAPVDGPYLAWVFTATGASSASITFPAPAGTFAMTKTGNGTFKYVSAWYEPSTLVGIVFATYVGTTNNPQLVISHGCSPLEELIPAWCSPGFWMNSTDAAWALTGYTRADLFNSTVFDGFYGATFAADPTLNTVLTTAGGTYKSASVAGTLGFPAMNAFNATGAFLTNSLPGYIFVGIPEIENCPIDHFGNLK